MAKRRQKKQKAGKLAEPLPKLRFDAGDRQQAREAKREFDRAHRAVIASLKAKDHKATTRALQQEKEAIRKFGHAVPRKLAD